MSEVVNSDTTNVVVNSDAQVVDKTAVVDTKLDTIVDNKQAEAPKSWVADDWREKLANGDAKELARLQRFPDLNTVYRSYRELEGKVSSGAFKQEVDVTKLDENQLAEYRKSIGVPEKAEDYELGIPEGVVLSDQDQIILGSVLETMHGQNRKPSEVKEVVNSFLEAREIERANFIEQQKYERQNTEEALRAEWGGNYIQNIAAIKNLVDSMPNGMGDQLISARLPDGTLLGNNKEALMALAGWAMELNPAGSVVPGVGSDQLQSIQAEKAELEALMRQDINAWRKNGAARERHRQLIDAELKLKARGH